MMYLKHLFYLKPKEIYYTFDMKKAIKIFHKVC